MEEQEDGAELGQHGEGLVGPQAGQFGAPQERQVAHDDPDEQLAQDRGLPEPLEQLAGQLGRHQDEGQGQEQGGDGPASVRGGGRRDEDVHAQPLSR